VSYINRKVLLIGWDAADWKIIRPLMAAGKMPHFRRLVERGASGPIATLHPPLSPMLWTSIATGKRPFKHGVHGFTEPVPDGSGVRPVTNLSRQSKAIWNILNQNGLRSIVIGWWPSHPAEPIDGVMVSDQFHHAVGPPDRPWPFPAGAVHPSVLAPTLADLRVHPEQLDPASVEPFIPLAREIDQDRDPRLAAFLRTFAECRSVHSAALWLLANQPWDFFAVYYDAIDHFCHGFMKYHPPRRPWIAERDFELYRRVVSAAYRYHDEMLANLLERAGPDTTVLLLSDHGFHPDRLRPAVIPDIPAGPAIEHRDFGVLAIAGPGIRHTATLHGASLLDIAPTILSLYGLPAGQDMDGQALSQAFGDEGAPTPIPPAIPSWEAVAGADGRHPPHTRLDPVAAHESIERMVALGYIEPPDPNLVVAAEKAVRELRYNLGESFQDAGRHPEAYEIFTQLHRAVPAEPRFAVRLFVSCQALGRREEMRQIVDSLDHSRDPHLHDYLEAQVLTAEKRYLEALAALQRISQSHSAVFLQTADLYLRLRHPREAQAVYQAALALDPDNVRAHAGLSRLALGRRDHALAANAALDALERTVHDPQPHFLLGRALAGMRQFDRAAEAFRAAIACNPNFPEAHLRLAALLETHLDDKDSAARHRALAHAMRRAAPPHSAETPEPEPIPELPPAADAPLPSIAGCVIIVTGLPRSGTSLVMQQLSAAGIPILTDGTRPPDEFNPRGYFEFEPVKNFRRAAEWLKDARGKAVKIVAPMLTALPPDVPCRVILCERDLDEVLASQDRMLRRDAPTAEDRLLLKSEYQRLLAQAKTFLQSRPATRFLTIHHRAAIFDPESTAKQLSAFLDCVPDPAKMSAAVDPSLYRRRAGSTEF
jgi:tetratricopeptide (TPR) repeat protein/arylsulfatase A-like enzyme